MKSSWFESQGALPCSLFIMRNHVRICEIRVLSGFQLVSESFELELNGIPGGTSGSSFVPPDPGIVSSQPPRSRVGSRLLDF